MAASRTNYTNSSSSSSRSAGSFSGGTYSSPRTNSFTCGNAKFSSILSSSSSFSPSSYLSDKYSHLSQGTPKSGTGSKLSPGGGVSSSNASNRGNSSTSAGSTSTTKFSANFNTKTSNFPSTSSLTREKSSGIDGFGGNSAKSGSVNSEAHSFRPSSSYLRSGPGTTCGNPRSASAVGNDARKSETVTTFGKSSAIGNSAVSGFYPQAPQPNAGNRATAELKSSTGGGMTYGAIGSSAIASLRTTQPPRYGLKTNVSIHQSYTSSYPGGNCAFTTPAGKSHKSRADDPTTPDTSKPTVPLPQNKEISLSNCGSLPSEDDSSVSSSSQLSGVKELEHLSSGTNDESNLSKDEAQVEKGLTSANKSYVSSIPRPSTTFYSPFSSALSRFTAGGEQAQTMPANKPSPINPNKGSDQMIKTMKGTDSSSESETSSSSTSSSIKNCKTGSGTGSIATATAIISGKGMMIESTLPSTPCQALNYTNNDNNTKSSSNSHPNKRENFQQQVGNNKRPPADPNKLPQSRSSSKTSIPTFSNKSPTPSLGSKPKIIRNNGPNCNTMKSMSSAESEGDLVDLDRRRGSGTSSSSGTSSRSNSSERSSSASITKSKVQNNPENKQISKPHPPSPPLVKNSARASPEKLVWVKRSPECSRAWWATTKESSSDSDGNNAKTILRNPNYPGNSHRLFEGSRVPNASPGESIGRRDASEGVIPTEFEIGVLGDRTSPDGTEIPNLESSPQNDGDDPNRTVLVTPDKKELFISSEATNVDDILGEDTLSSPHEETEGSFKLQSGMGDDVNVILSDLDSNENREGGLGELKADSSDSDSDSDEDEDGTGSCSSFEEVDPNSIDSNIPSQGTGNYPSQEGANLGITQGSTAASFLPSVKSCQDLKNLPQNSFFESAEMSTTVELDDATLQIYRDGDFGAYLDLEASIDEQQEEFESFLSSRKNSIVLRGQLPFRVNAIIEKLLTADGRELRRALFSLKQIFQEDKDLVHEFVENGGLSCLIKVGSEADQNYQNYILRALGSIMLYVDGMFGVMRHNETIQWLYSLVASKFRLVQKTALKLLLVFVDYVETNCLLLVEAVSSVDSVRGAPCWRNVMNLLHEYDSGDTELLVYAMSLVNKVLNGIPDTDTYYDQVDALEEQGMAALIQKYMGKQCADLDLLQQLQIYEVVLKHEDGEEDITLQLDENMRQKLMNRKGYIELNPGNNKKGRRKSRRHSSNSLNITPPTTPTGMGSPVASFPHPMIRRLSSAEDSRRDSDEWSSSDVSSTHSASPAPSVTGSVMSSPIILNGFSQENYSNDVGITPGLRKRREAEGYERSHSREFPGLEQLTIKPSGQDEFNAQTNSSPGSPLIPLGRSPSLKRDVHSLVNPNGSPEVNKTRPWALPVYPSANSVGKPACDPKENGVSKDEPTDLSQLKRESTVKDLTQKLSSQSQVTSPDETKIFSRTGDLSGVISKAKEGLAKSKSKVDIKPTPQFTEPNGTSLSSHGMDKKKSDNELHWDFLVSNISRSLEICDLDFTGLKPEDDVDVISSQTISQLCNMSMKNGVGLPPPMPNGMGPPPPPPGFKLSSLPKNPPAPPVFGIALKHQGSSTSTDPIISKPIPKKTKKTVKLFWKEVRDDPVTAIKVQDIGSIWDELQPIPLDTQKLEHLFESRAKDLITKKQQDVNKCKEVVVLDPKRSNAINIGMTKLAPPRTIKAAIMKMDSTIINREGIEKLLTMLPTDEERAKIQEAQFANPDTPLGNAEQFLLTLASISELNARLKLWAFKLDYENLEKEIAEPLMDLKLGIESLQTNKTFRCILTTLLSIGNFLNGADAKGFQIEYLAKVPEVKDTVHKHSLLHHLCHTVIEKFPDSSDLYSEIGPVTRASRVDFDELATNLAKMEIECKASWDYLRLIAKHDGPTNMKLKMSEFLADCAERIIVLGIIHRRVMNRFHKFLLWLGVSAHQVPTTKPHYLFKVVSEFALEYRTTRERVLQQLQKKASHRERNKTRGKLITDQMIYKTTEDKADAELRHVLSNSNDGLEDMAKGSLTWTRRSKPPATNNSLIKNNLQNRAATLGRAGGVGDGDDEILESLVKTATQAPAPRSAPRERKRNNSRFAERKSLRRTLRHGLTDEERKLLSALVANGQTI